jgi:hypothetical protein
MQEFVSTKEMAERLGSSMSYARQLAKQLGYYQGEQTRRSNIRVPLGRFEQHIKDHMIEPDYIPRPTPYETNRQILERETKEWHKRRHT